MYLFQIWGYSVTVGSGWLLGRQFMAQADAAKKDPICLCAHLMWSFHHPKKQVRNDCCLPPRPSPCTLLFWNGPGTENTNAFGAYLFFQKVNCIKIKYLWLIWCNVINPRHSSGDVAWRFFFKERREAFYTFSVRESEDGKIVEEKNINKTVG